MYKGGLPSLVVKRGALYRFKGVLAPTTRVGLQWHNGDKEKRAEEAINYLQD